MSNTPGRGRGRRDNRMASDLVRPGTQRRIEWSFYLLLVPLFFLTARLVQLQAVQSRERRDGGSTSGIFDSRKILPPRRAEILANDGTAMAITLDEYTVAANPRAVSDKQEMARLIASAIGGSQDEYYTLLQKTTRADGKPNRYVRLARRVNEARIDKLRALMLPRDKKESSKARAARKAFWEPITLEASPRRTYPLGEFASQLIGFTGSDERGMDGLEAAWNSELAGKPGEIISQVDARNRPVPGFVAQWTPPITGRSVVTTIWPEIQADTDAALREMVKQYRPNFAVAIVMRPRTGEIVAMSTAPSFNPNNKPANVAELATNRCISFAYEPGSTFKVITASAAVENVPDWQSHSFVCNGVQRVGKHNMHCWVNSVAQRRHGDETLSESIRDSCNFGVYGFARLAGAPTMLEYAKKFGLGRSIEIAGIRGPAGYLARDAHDWNAAQLANFAFGQGMSMTPLQLTRVAATIANDGVMMKPLLVKQLRDEQGKVVREFHPTVERRVIQPETARAVTTMMERVTQEGTARKFVFVPGYSVAGKTGSAQKAVGRQGYVAGKFISSLVGFVPSRKPEFVILVMADEPRGSHWGSEVCGPPFATIATKAMLHLRLREGTAAPAPSQALMEPKKEKVSKR